jgi:hypothetical protein
MPQITTEYSDCIQACYECMLACNHCYTSCLNEPDHHVAMMKECIRLDRECADMCKFAVAAMSMNDSYAKEVCRLCAEICESCGNECKKHDHEHCQRCAEACFKCAEACRKMAV